MVKVAVLSDTHNVLNPQVKEVIKSCDAIVHAGDFARESVLDELRNMGRVYVVRGNNDKEWAVSLRDTLRFEIGGIHFFMTHNKKDVDRNLEGIDVVIFGHSHHYFLQEIDGRLWLNPGACGRPRFGGSLSMAVLTIDEQKSPPNVTVEKIEILPTLG